MLLLRSDTLPEGPAWAYELKLDGYRALGIKSYGVAHLRSRTNKSFDGRYMKRLFITVCPEWPVPGPSMTACDNSIKQNRSVIAASIRKIREVEPPDGDRIREGMGRDEEIRVGRVCRRKR